MRPRSRLSSQPLMIPASRVILHIEWYIPMVSTLVTTSCFLAGNRNPELKPTTFSTFFRVFLSFFLSLSLPFSLSLSFRLSPYRLPPLQLYHGCDRPTERVARDLIFPDRRPRDRRSQRFLRFVWRSLSLATLPPKSFTLVSVTRSSLPLLSASLYHHHHHY